jgi:hypothetical protein
MNYITSRLALRVPSHLVIFGHKENHIYPEAAVAAAAAAMTAAALEGTELLLPLRVDRWSELFRTWLYCTGPLLGGTFPPIFLRGTVGVCCSFISFSERLRRLSVCTETAPELRERLGR